MKDAVAAAAKPVLSFAELVAFTAAVMALNALAIDMMLPALGIIGEELGTRTDNDRQLIIVVYILGNGVAQLFFGPLVDRFGRRPVLLISIAAYVGGCILSVVAQSFTLFLAARVFQGVATAGARVALIAVVRDLYAGRRMAELMSFAMMVFMAAPILAPGIGQLILFVAPWRAIFFALLVYGAAIFLWAALRVPETMAPADKMPLNIPRIVAAYRTFLTDRIALGYSIASALSFGVLFGYISASEQIFLQTFELGARFPLAFAAVAVSLAIANLTNARIVGRFGMRRLAHGAVIVLFAANALHFAVAGSGMETFVSFMAFMMITFFCLGLIGSNMAALALQPMGHIAGAAAAANGFAGTTLAGLVGGLIARQYDGTTAPVIAGFAIVGFCALLVILWTERGRLFGVGAEAATAAR